jgi:outer membrane protein
VPPCRALDVLISTAMPPRPIGLEEAYQLALKRSETLAISSEAVVQALSQLDNLWAAAKPNITSNLYQKWETAIPIQYQPFSPPSQQYANFNVKQLVFSGFREILAVQAGRANKRQAVYNMLRAEDMLYQSVAAAYYNLWNVQKNVSIDEAMLKILKDRARDLSAWVRIGRSRDSDFLATDSQRAQTAAQILAMKAQEGAAEELMIFLTGVEARFMPKDETYAHPLPLSNYVERVSMRPDVRAQKQALESAKFSLKSAQRAMIPLITFQGNYYPVQPGFLNVIKWDAGFFASIPLYTGGQIAASIRTARSQMRSAEQNFSMILRTAIQEVRTYYGNLIFGIDEVRAYDNAEALAAQSAEAQMRDYRRGLVTNISVLDSLTTLQQIRLTLAASRAQTFLSAIQLAVAAGRSTKSLPKADLP